MPDLFDIARQKVENAHTVLDKKDIFDKKDERASLFDTMKEKGDNFLQTVRKEPRPISKLKSFQVKPTKDPFTMRPYSNWSVHSQPEIAYDLMKFGSAVESIRRSLRIIEDFENRISGR